MGTLYEDYEVEEMDDLEDNSELSEEYENTFSSEEKLQRSLKINRDNFTLDIGVVSFKECASTEPIKKGRKETHLGLTQSISELGILSPIHVMVTEGFAMWVEDGNSPEDYEGYKYAVIDGFRRMYCGIKTGLTRCNAIIWDFKNKEQGSELLTTLSLVLNKIQKHSWSEIWYLMEILEMQSNLTPGTLEYLLQLESGDAMKLKEIMQRADDFPEPKEDLLSNKKTLQQCFNALQKIMKEQDQIMKEDQQGISEVEQAEGVVDEEDKDGLSDDEVREILEMEDNFDGELSEEDFDELAGNNLADERQTVGERHPLDPALRAAVLTRDGYCCQITGRGKGLPANIALSILNVHHKIPVHAGGTDVMDNLITVCLDAHTLIHIIERNNGKVGMSKEQYDALPEEEQVFMRGVMKIARIAVAANKRVGNSKEKIKEATSSSIKFKMPGLVQKENMEAVAAAKVDK